MAGSGNVIRKAIPELGVPPRLSPFLRLVAVAALVIAGDMATEHLTNRGGAMDPWVVTLVRIASSLAILRFPLAGAIFALEVDKWDWYWLDAGNRSEADQALYQRWDKVMDLVTLGMAAIVTLRWRDRLARGIALAMFGWRAAGALAFVATGQSWLLIAFPNAFESMFLLYMIFQVLSGQTVMLTTKMTALVVSLCVFIPKLAEEFFLHAFDNRPWNMFETLPEPLRDGLLWGAAMYAIPLIALVVLTLRAHGHPTRGDPEEQLSAV